jgi:hypothetical protein
VSDELRQLVEPLLPRRIPVTSAVLVRHLPSERHRPDPELLDEPSVARTACARQTWPVKLHGAAWLALVALVVGCGGGSDAVRESLADVDPSGGYWAIRATCEGGRFEVDFRPERLSVQSAALDAQGSAGDALAAPNRVPPREGRTRRSEQKSTAMQGF